MVRDGPRHLVICGPSGCGKSTLIKLLLNDFPDEFGYSVSHTTRGPRRDEQNGVDYHFTDKKSMEASVARGEFIETAIYVGNMYGTSKQAVEDVVKSGKICILDISTEGVKNVKTTDLNPVYAFVKPPSMEVLELRLKIRNTEREEIIQKRLSKARAEIEYGETKGDFDIVIVNDNLQIAYGELRDFVKSQFHDLKRVVIAMVRHGPRPLVISGPSGCGKSTLVKQLLKEFPNKFGYSVSHTTRGPRHGEKNGVDYHFIDKKSMEAAVARGEFIETDNYSDNIYGTSKQSVGDVVDSGKICVLDISMEGVKNVKTTDLNPLYVFVKPPSKGVLEHRLWKRNTENDETIQKRLRKAPAELEYGETKGNFDIVIVNDNFETAYGELCEFVKRHFRELKRDGPVPK